MGEAENLWHDTDPTAEEIKAAVDAFDFTGYHEFVFCGYGEPTCALDVLLEVGRYVKEKCGLPVRVDTNGLANLYHGRDVVPELAGVVDSISISMNAPDEETYQKVTRPRYPNAFSAMLDFAEACGRVIPHTRFTIVDVLSPEDIARCRAIAEGRGVPLKVRKYSE